MSQPVGATGARDLTFPHTSDSRGHDTMHRSIRLAFVSTLCLVLVGAASAAPAWAAPPANDAFAEALLSTMLLKGSELIAVASIAVAPAPQRPGDPPRGRYA